MYRRTFLQSFSEALKGLLFVIKTERNMRIHLCLAVLAICAALIFKVSGFEFMLILFSIALVLVAETANTAFELLLDFMNGNKYHDTVKMLKDIAAGGVLIASINALIVGAIVFGSKILFKQCT